MLKGVVALLAVRSEFHNEDKGVSQAVSRKVADAPPGVKYEENLTVFGGILRGETEVSWLMETEELVAFRDHKPRAPLHGLVIPKRHISGVGDLTVDDIGLVESMRDMALNVIEMEQPEAYQKKDYILCFHVPPFNSVDHLHLHCLAPASEMAYVMRYGKYQVGTRWCTSDTNVVEQLQTNKRFTATWPWL